MKCLSFLFAAAFVAVSISACSKPAEAPAKDATATNAAANTRAQDALHASAAVKPGSHEDWCGEHGVAESQCTRCNPKLIAAFKATNDWCGEHGVPESQCLKCHPELKIVRPPKES